MLWRASILILCAGCANVIDHDAGGFIGERAASIATSAPAEIRGYCASACTMHLSNGCVYPDARLVFHGPQTGDADAFDRWSDVMAGHYPPALAAWFMSQGRYRTSEMTGAQAVEMGATPCLSRAATM